MEAGSLRHVISIQEKTQTSDGMGGFTTTWADVSGLSSLRASIWPLRATERLDNAKLELSITHRIRIRYRAGITPDMRVKFGSRYFNIRSIINPDERNKMLEFLAEEVI